MKTGFVDDGRNLTRLAEIARKNTDLTAPLVAALTYYATRSPPASVDLASALSSGDELSLFTAGTCATSALLGMCRLNGVPWTVGYLDRLRSRGFRIPRFDELPSTKGHIVGTTEGFILGSAGLAVASAACVVLTGRPAPEIPSHLNNLVPLMPSFFLLMSGALTGFLGDAVEQPAQGPTAPGRPPFAGGDGPARFLPRSGGQIGPAADSDESKAE